MKDAMGRGEPAVVVGQARNNHRKARKRTNEHCSICTDRIWFDAVPLMEPEDVPEPRHAWVLCRQCYQALMIEMRRSPVRSPLRLRIAMGLVAAERSPKAYTMSEQWEFQRELAWFMRLMILFALLHLVIFVILLAVPK